MFTHLFKLIWNKKRQNFLLITEIFVSFLVMFAVFTLLVYSYNNLKQPVGFDYNNVWVINYFSRDDSGNKGSDPVFHESLQQLVRTMPEVDNVSFAGSNIPFSMSSHNSQVSYGEIKGVETSIYDVGEEYQRLLKIKMIQGRWLAKGENGSKIRAAVITSKLRDRLFGKQDALGKTISDYFGQFKIIGVAEDIKDRGDYLATQNGIYILMDSAYNLWNSTMLVKVKTGADAVFESKLFKTLSNATGASIEIEHLDKKLQTRNRLMLIPIIITSVVAGFLVINVALGLFGVLWYNINKRKVEIGLRRAVGASGRAVSLQLVGEALVLSTFSLILGCFFAIQFPLMNVFDLPAATYLIAIVFSLLFIYLLTLICAFYPGRQAAAIYPAIALHEE